MKTHTCLTVPCLSLLLLSAAALTVMAQDATEPNEPVETTPAAAAPQEPGAAPAPAVGAGDEAVIPAPYDVSRYQASWDKNPFLLKTPVITTTAGTWEQDWALGGMVRNGSKEQVTIVNKQTGESKRLALPEGNRPDAEFKLISAVFNRSRDKASATVSKGGKEATVKYDENLTSKPVTIVNTQRAPAAQNPGAPGAVNPAAGGRVPGQVIRPGGVSGARPGTNASLPPMPTTTGMQPATSLPGMNGSIPTNPAAPVAPSITRRRQLIPSPPPVAQ